MKTHNIISDGFQWVPLDKRISRFGGQMSPRTPETRTPLLWLARHGNDLYLVNNTQEPLELVTGDSGGFQTVDDDVVTLENENLYKYTDVKPNEAVKVDEYDGYYDLDFLIQVYLKVKSASLGHIYIQTPPKRGGVEETVILWNTGELGKRIVMKQL